MLKSAIDCNFSDAKESLRHTERNNTWYRVFPNNLKLPDEFKDSKLIHGIIDYDQVVFQSCNDDIWPKNRIAHFINRWGLDTLDCSPSFINSFINGAIGNYQGKESYILDENNNLDLTDDKIHPISDSIYILHDVVIDRFINKKIVHDTISIQVLSPRLDRDNNQVMGLFFKYCKYWKTNLTLDDTSIEILLYPDYYYVFHKKPRISIKTSDSVNQSIVGCQYFEINNSNYKINSISKKGDLISITKQPGHNIPTSNQIGYYPPNFQINDSVRLRDLQGKFVYLYFWNYNCSPCLSNLPKKFAKYVSSEFDHVEFILISVDKPKQTRKFLRKNNITWANIETIGNSQLYNDYDISMFPTEFLVDPSGILIDSGAFLNIDGYIDH